MSFAVLDFETTGTYWKVDRVVEVGLVLLDRNFQVEGEFETLVNPSRDLGPQHIHGIKSSWVLEAPTFAQIAPEFGKLIENRTVVAHNALFDAKFAERELQRVFDGFEFEWGENGLPSGFLCTKKLSKFMFGVQAQSLGWLASALGLSNERPHAAISDARLTAEIFARLAMDAEGVQEAINECGEHASPQIVEVLEFSSVVRPMLDQREKSRVEILIDNLEPVGSSIGISEFSTALLQSVLDLEVSTHQAQELNRLAQELGMGVKETQEARDAVFLQLAAHFWDDGLLSSFESGSLDRLAESLSISSELLEQVKLEPLSKEMSPILDFGSNDLFLLTGFPTKEKSELSEMLEKMGKKVTDSFSKKVTFVIALDPDTQSGKAKSARKNGVPVLGDAFVFYLWDRFQRQAESTN